MRKLLSIFVTAFWGMIGVPVMMLGSAFSAGIIEYTPPPAYEIPEVDYGLGGNFYLRGSVAGALWQAGNGSCGCLATFTTPGYGYSVGVGFGYETGDGLRGDVTVDYLSLEGLTSVADYRVGMRSALLLANAYYDFNLGGYGAAEGGFGAYVGAGIGMAKNYSEVRDAGGTLSAWGTSLEAAAAIMGGVSYDMGNMVADVGYRGIYMNKVMSQPANVADIYIISNNLIHEARASLRYRLN